MTSGLLLAVLAAFIYTIHLGYNDPTPRAAPGRPVGASSDAEWLLLPFQLIGGLAALLWCLLGLLVFLGPLLFVAAVVWGVLQ
jgi:hypothetical protein